MNPYAKRFNDTIGSDKQTYRTPVSSDVTTKLTLNKHNVNPRMPTYLSSGSVDSKKPTLPKNEYNHDTSTPIISQGKGEDTKKTKIAKDQRVHFEGGMVTLAANMKGIKEAAITLAGISKQPTKKHYGTKPTTCHHGEAIDDGKAETTISKYGSQNVTTHVVTGSRKKKASNVESMSTNESVNIMSSIRNNTQLKINIPKTNEYGKAGMTSTIRNPYAKTATKEGDGKVAVKTKRQCPGDWTCPPCLKCRQNFPDYLKRELKKLCFNLQPIDSEVQASDSEVQASNYKTTGESDDEGNDNTEQPTKGYDDDTVTLAEEDKNQHEDANKFDYNAGEDSDSDNTVDKSFPKENDDNETDDVCVICLTEMNKATKASLSCAWSFVMFYLL